MPISGCCIDIDSCGILLLLWVLSMDANVLVVVLSAGMSGYTLLAGMR